MLRHCPCMHLTYSQSHTLRWLLNSPVFLMGKLSFRRVNLTRVLYVVGNKARIQELMELAFMLLKRKGYFCFGYFLIPPQIITDWLPEWGSEWVNNWEAKQRFPFHVVWIPSARSTVKLPRLCLGFCPWDSNSGESHISSRPQCSSTHTVWALDLH